MVWNGMEISAWNMEDARMEWNGRFQEWNGRQPSILSYQFHTRFWALYLQKNTYRCRVGILSQKYSTSMSTHINCRQIAVLWLCTLRKQCTYCILIVILIAALMLQLTTLIDLTCCCFFILRVTICPVVNFFFLYRHENS